MKLENSLGIVIHDKKRDEFEYWHTQLGLKP